jgi:hypothetical protein
MPNNNVIHLKATEENEILSCSANQFWLPKNKEIRLARNAGFVEINISSLDPYCPHRYFQECKISSEKSLCIDAKSGRNMHKEQANKHALILIYKYMHTYMYICACVCILTPLFSNPPL